MPTNLAHGTSIATRLCGRASSNRPADLVEVVRVRTTKRNGSIGRQAGLPKARPPRRICQAAARLLVRAEDRDVGALVVAADFCIHVGHVFISFATCRSSFFAHPSLAIIRLLF